jgi:transcriptional regulator with XRE-family HTH domain
MTRTQLATAVGISSAMLGSIERGEKRVGAIELFALRRALGVEVANFYVGLRDIARVP